MIDLVKMSDVWKLRTCPRCGAKMIRVYRTKSFFCPKCHPEYTEENEKLKTDYRTKIAERKDPKESE